MIEIGITLKRSQGSFFGEVSARSGALDSWHQEGLGLLICWEPAMGQT
jgi:hypothetical protein